MEKHHAILSINAVLVILLLIILYYVYKTNKTVQAAKKVALQVAYPHYQQQVAQPMI